MPSDPLNSIKKAETELNWYFNHSAADLGICSSFSSIISAAFGFSPASAVNHTEDKMLEVISRRTSPARKLRGITQAFSRLPQPTRRIIDALYGNYAYPPQLVAIFGTKTGAALFNSHVQDLKSLISLCRRKIQKTTSPDDNSLIAQIKIETESIYQHTHQAYLFVRSSK